VDACAHEILDSGCQYVLISDNLGRGQKLCNNLYSDHRLVKRYEWPRINTPCHGSGATLASSIASYLAHGLSIMDAVEQGQKFTWQSLNQARRLGMGKYIPDRFHWLRDVIPSQKNQGAMH
jgi:hydroxymethylpyrimidine/phosphomethylpyrimidine kinase